MKTNYNKIKSMLKNGVEKLTSSSVLLKTILPLSGLLYFTEAKSQASISCTPNVSCSFSDQIDAFSLNNIAATGIFGCSSGSYGFFPTPVWSLTMGNTYPWTATTGSWQQGIAIWIDLNNDGFYTANEQMASTPSANNHSGTIYIPFTAVPGTNRRMRVRCNYATQIGNTNNTACDSWTYGETQDFLVDIIAPPPCSGIPSANSVVTPSNGICPGAFATLSLATTYSTFGYTYQWQSSTVSVVGPFNSITSATNAAYTTPTLNINTYYQAVITCTNGNGVTTASTGLVMIQGTTISQVPYFEGFEGITKNNELPNCSWSATSPTTVARTYTTSLSQGRTAYTGNKFASFYYSPTGTNYFYTNGIQMYAGVTYSASLWFKTEYYGYLTWTDMSIMLGTSQSTTGLTTIATTGGPAASSGYKALSNTFTVASSGVYYLAIKGANAGICCAYHLNWDDLRVEIPCSLNTPTVTMSANNTTICSGNSVNLTASGANTFTWSTGSNATQINEMPGQTTLYTVMGQDSLTGCPASASQLVVVNQTPELAIVANPAAVCAGSPVVITAFGASSYTWSNNNGNNNSITVSPTITTTYQLIGENPTGCQAQISQVVTVNSLPVVSATSDRSEICKGESATLTGGGAVTYQWASNSLFIQSAQAIVSPNNTTTYTLTGTNANGCKGITTIMQTVQECVGLGEMTTTLAGVKVYPNPTGGAFVVELNNGAEKMVTLSDVTGRVVLTNSTTNETMNVNISNLSNGIYYVKIQSQNAVEVIKVIKN